MKADIRLNERGHRCPMPVIAVAKAAKEAASGTVIGVACTDPGAASDIPAWCQLKGVEFVGSQEEPDGATTYYVKIP